MSCSRAVLTRLTMLTDRSPLDPEMDEKSKTCSGPDTQTFASFSGTIGGSSFQLTGSGPFS